ncbi:MAG TPA: VWA domain-containing protein [Thermoanaerobaculia bacterium]|nr:VWA domain-containing protein [Thermoanaerobaculia bacterium]
MNRFALSPRRHLAFLALAALPALGAAPGPTTVPPPPGEATPSFHDEMAVAYVLVPVMVRTRSGYANDLQKKDFRLLVDGRPVAIESFDQRTEAPASLVFLQDLSGSMETGGKIEQSRQVVRFFLDRALPGDEFAVASFASGRGEVEVPFTTDSGAVRDAIALWRGWGTTALHDAVAWIPEISAEGHNSRRFAILLTDGADNASALAPEQAREIVRAAQVPVYVLGLGTGSPYEIAADGKKLYRYADVLNLLAGATGGRYYPIGGQEDLARALQGIADDLRHQYVLGFSTIDGASSYRKLRVELTAKGLGDRTTVVFRRGYKGPPPAGSSRGG